MNIPELPQCAPPTEEELASAPVAHEWQIGEFPIFQRFPGDHRIFAYFEGHPLLVHGERGASSQVLGIDTARPPRWARCESRVYRLGKPKSADVSAALAILDREPDVEPDPGDELMSWKPIPGEIDDLEDATTLIKQALLADREQKKTPER